METDQGWIPDDQYSYIQGVMPIACTDFLIWRTIDGIVHYGLILRDAPNGEQRWCLIGGRIKHNESPVEAGRRHLRETLGDSVAVSIEEAGNGLFRPEVIAEYSHSPSADGRPFDHRQHSIALTYLVESPGGDPVPSGEARDFKWVPTTQIAEFAERLCGFGQEVVVLDLTAQTDH